ncbi:MAG: zinc-dependent metalloprotease [Candidatus Eremiobacteraeota bacterium]|nr:zinc-dependent metalloprotease [Candidatus Eremiobacteraeota bacterium]
MIARRFVFVLVALVSSFVPQTPAFAATASPAPSPSPSTAASAPAPPAAFSLPGLLGAAGAPQSYAQFIKKTERQAGLLDIVRKDDDVYFDLGPEKLDRPFIVAPVLASGVGVEAFAGRVYPTFLLEFKRVGKRILWIDKNADFSAPPGSSAANALAISVTDSVINSTPIVAEDDEKKHIVISAAFFLGDFENVGRDLGGGNAPVLIFGPAPHSGFTVDAARSYLERTKALPKNDEILANLAFSGPAGDLSGAPDGRGVRLRMHYSILEAPPPDSYVPRLADDRVGYFITAQKRFDNDALPTPFVRYIDRWNFANGPIVYYLTNEIPAAYKRPIRAALLQWNAAFAKIGIPNAIEVRDQPNDPAWDPDDIRYSTVRWITSDRPAFAAYGPSIADPRTGEILRVEIVIDGESIRTIKRGYVDQVLPSRIASLGSAGLPVAQRGVMLRCDDPGACDTFDGDSAALAAMGVVSLRAAGSTPARTERFAEDWLQMAVLHESGHNFGLRHNFISATLYSLAEIHDKHFTQGHGLVGSVMGYTPTNLSPPGKPQGDYFQLRLGPYDYWAIRYGYEKLPNVRRPDDEKIALRGIASESSRREYAYATDEDAEGPLAIDPRVAVFQLSSDPLAFDANQFAVVDDLLGKLDRSYPRDDRPYYEERRTFETLLTAYERAAMLATKYVGGSYTSRDHRGQVGGHAPMRPVSRDQARRAFALLAAHVFSSKAMRYSPQLLADLGPEHFLHRGVDSVEATDFPVADYVGSVQDDVLFAVFSPDAMSRLADDAYEVSPGTRLMSLDDLFGWTQAAVWDDLGPRLASIDPLHRALQRRYTNLMIAFSLAPSFLISAIGYPSDTVPLARYQLRGLARSVDAALHSRRLDTATRAHLEDVQSRVRHALDPSATRGV